MKNIVLITALILAFSISLTAQFVEGTPCTAICFDANKSSFSGRLPNQNGIYPNEHIPCGTEILNRTEDNPAWWIMRPSGNKLTFSVTTSNQIFGYCNKYGVEMTLWEGDNCGSVTAINCFVGESGILETAVSPCKVYYLQIDGICEGVCNITCTYDKNQLLREVPAPKITGPTQICSTNPGKFTATLPTLTGCSPDDWKWTMEPANAGTITKTGGLSSQASVKITNPPASGKVKVCAEPIFKGKCPPKTNKACYEVGVLSGQPLQLPPIILCEGEKVLKHGVEFSCADEGPEPKRFSKNGNPTPLSCDSLFDVLVQCIKVDPKIRTSLACNSGNQILNAADASVTSPGNVKSALYTGIGKREYKWKKDGVILAGEIDSKLTILEKGMYEVTLKYTYEVTQIVNGVSGIYTRSCEKSASINFDSIPMVPLAEVPIPTSNACANQASQYYVLPDSSAFSYKWLVTGGAEIVGPDNDPKKLEVLNKGNSYQVCLEKRACNQTSLPKCITVNPLPEVAIPKVTVNPICQGENVKYQIENRSQYGSDVHFSWSVLSGKISFFNVDSTIISVTWDQSITIGKISVTATGFCDTKTLSSPVISTQYATIKRINALCVGENLQLEINNSGTSYHWEGPNGFTSNLQNPKIDNVTLKNSGLYAVTISNSNGCFSISSLTVTVNMCAQKLIEGTPCTATCLDANKSSIIGRLPDQDNISPNLNIPCGGGNSEDNPAWWVFRPSTDTVNFSFTTSNCIPGTAGSLGVQITLWQGDNCGKLTAIDCYTGLSGTLRFTPTIPGSTCYLQIDGFAECQCDINFNYMQNQILKETPAPKIKGASKFCTGDPSTYTATLPTLPGYKPMDWRWTLEPANAGSLVKLAGASNQVSVRITNPPTNKKVKVCAEPVFTGLCPSTTKKACYDVNILPDLFCRNADVKSQRPGKNRDPSQNLLDFELKNNGTYYQVDPKKNDSIQSTLTKHITEYPTAEHVSPKFTDVKISSGDSKYNVMLNQNEFSSNAHFNQSAIGGKISALHADSTAKSEIKVFPNPANDRIIISSSTTIFKLEFSNLLGQLLLEKSSDASEISIDVSNLPEGKYFLKVYSSTREFEGFKINIQH